jgi:hypothetical protein
VGGTCLDIKGVAFRFRGFWLLVDEQFYPCETLEQQLYAVEATGLITHLGAGILSLRLLRVTTSYSLMSKKDFENLKNA